MPERSLGCVKGRWKNLVSGSFYSHHLTLFVNTSAFTNTIPISFCKLRHQIKSIIHEYMGSENLFFHEGIILFATNWYDELCSIFEWPLRDRYTSLLAQNIHTNVLMFGGYPTAFHYIKQL